MLDGVEYFGNLIFLSSFGGAFSPSYIYLGGGWHEVSEVDRAKFPSRGVAGFPDGVEYFFVLPRGRCPQGGGGLSYFIHTHHFVVLPRQRGA